MKMNYKIIFFVFYLFVCKDIYAQFLPNWLKMGMEKIDIENNLNGEIFERQPNMYVHVLSSPGIIYQFKIDPKKGLTEYWIVSIYFNIENLIDDYTLFFGEHIYQDNKYWWFEKNRLPDDIIAICISNSGRAVNIAFFFMNYLE